LATNRISSSLQRAGSLSTSHLIKLFNGLHQRRSRQRPMSRLVQQAHRLLDLLSFSAVTRQQLGWLSGCLKKASIGRGRDRG
jgi:hypothetical protein